MDANTILVIVAMTLTNTFWMFAIVWENEQRRREAVVSYNTRRDTP